MDDNQGFSLIEVLVALVLIATGMLGMLALQSKSIQYTQDSVNRNLAITLSNDLLEMMRTHRQQLFNHTPPEYPSYSELKSATAIYSASGALRLQAESCPTASVPQSLLEHANCWFKLVETHLPGAKDADVNAEFKLCPSFKSGACAGSGYQGSSLELQLAWRVKQGECMDDLAATVCTYRTRVEL